MVGKMLSSEINFCIYFETVLSQTKKVELLVTDRGYQSYTHKTRKL